MVDVAQDLSRGDGVETASLQGLGCDSTPVMAIWSQSWVDTCLGRPKSTGIPIPKTFAGSISGEATKQGTFFSLHG